MPVRGLHGAAQRGAFGGARAGRRHARRPRLTRGIGRAGVLSSPADRACQHRASAPFAVDRGAEPPRWPPSNPKRTKPPWFRHVLDDRPSASGPRSPTSIASCPGSSSTPASCTRRATSGTRCSSGPGSWRSSRATSTSSSRSGSRASASRSRPARSTRAPDGLTAAEQLAAARDRVLELVAEHRRSSPNSARSWPAEGIEIVDYSQIPEHHDAPPTAVPSTRSTRS